MGSLISVNQMQIQMWLESIARVVNQIGGYFTFKIGDEEYVVMKKSDLEKDSMGTQLELGSSEQSLRDDDTEAADGQEEGLSRPSVEAEVSINDLQPHHIPLDHDAIQEDGGSRAGNEEIGRDAADDNIEWPAADDLDQNKVRFEPLKGDLPPELQE